MTLTVPPHFFQNGGCDATKISFSKIEKIGTGKSLPDLKSRVALKSRILWGSNDDFEGTFGPQNRQTDRLTGASIEMYKAIAGRI